MGMTFSQIDYFLVAAQQKSISRASELLYVSQPAVSKQLAMLESELGVQLFVRKKQGLEITKAGKAFENLFSEFKSNLSQTIEEIRSGNTDPRSTYHLGCMEGWDLQSFFPGLQFYLGERFPEVQLALDGYSIGQILYALERGEVDGAIVTESLLEGLPDVTTYHLTQLQSVLLFSARHPLAGRTGLTLADFSDTVFYVTTPFNMKQGVGEVLSLCKKSGFTPRLEYTSTLSSVLMKMQTGQGALLTNEWVMAKNNPIFSSLCLDHKRDIGFAAIARRETPLKAQVRETIMEYFAEKRTGKG